MIDELLDKIQQKGFDREAVSVMLKKGVFIHSDPTHTLHGSIYCAKVWNDVKQKTCTVQLFGSQSFTAHCVDCKSERCDSVGAAVLQLFGQIKKLSIKWE